MGRKGVTGRGQPMPEDRAQLKGKAVGVAGLSESGRGW